jgi:hypothetical protein
MPVSPELLQRAGDLKQELVQFGRRPRYAAVLTEWLADRFDPRVPIDEGTLAISADAFLLQQPLEDGRTVLEHFVAAHPRLPAAERAMLRGCRDVVEGVFVVERRDGDALVTTNLVDELPYRRYSNLGPGSFAQLPPRSFLTARLVPIDDAWMISGAIMPLPAAKRAAAYRIAVDLTSRQPELPLRNPAKLERARELQREDRQAFVDFFGSDVVLITGAELAERMQAFSRFREYERRDAAGRTPADRARERYGREPPLPQTDYGDLVDERMVAVIYDEAEGCYFIPDYDEAEQVFASPELLRDSYYVALIRAYLAEPSIPPTVLRRLAARDPARASEVFRQVLGSEGKPGLLQRASGQRPVDWERDGEALLRRYKPSYFDRPVLPSVTPVNEQLAPMMAATRRGAGRPAPVPRPKKKDRKQGRRRR